MEFEVVVALSEEVVVCSGVPLDEGVVEVPTATGMLDEPAETVDVAVAIAPQRLGRMQRGQRGRRLGRRSSSCCTEGHHPLG